MQNFHAKFSGVTTLTIEEDNSPTREEAQLVRNAGTGRIENDDDDDDDSQYL